LRRIDSSAQWVRNGLTLTTADDYNSKVLSEKGAAPANVSAIHDKNKPAGFTQQNHRI
jgi:hypothetical protein